MGMVFRDRKNSLVYNGQIWTVRIETKIDHYGDETDIMRVAVDGVDCCYARWHQYGVHAFDELEGDEEIYRHIENDPALEHELIKCGERAYLDRVVVENRSPCRYLPVEPW